jgi:6,7-dimethyl-8-ribityllumazine synthase
MSDRDIDSTSENVLHDWASEQPAAREPEETVIDEPDADGDSPAWGSASTVAEATEQPASTTVEIERDEAVEIIVRDDEAAEELEAGDAAIDDTPIHVELSHEHAAGDLHIPDGYAVLEGAAQGGRRAVGVVVSRFNGKVTTQLLDGALAELAAAGVSQEAITIMIVPGAFELPLAATALAKTRRFACIVALGCVIRGDTPHFDYVSSEAASGLQLAALETGVPVSFGVLTLDRVEQAEARIGKGAEAVRGALEMADLFAHLRAAASR